MKYSKLGFTLIYILLINPVSKAQNDSTFYDDIIENPIKISKGQEQRYLQYAFALLKQDSALKAYQILSRLHNTKQYNESSQGINAAMKTIRRKISKQSRAYLLGKWNLTAERISNRKWGLDSTRTQQVIISKRKIRFYEKDKPTITYKYTYRLQVSAYFGSVSYLIMDKNSFEAWVYYLTGDSKNEKTICMERYKAMSHDYYAVYTKSE